MKLKNFNIIFCLACIICITWMKTNFQSLNELLRTYQYTQGITSQLGITDWWAKTLDGKVKYILFWPNTEFLPFYNLTTGQDEFIRLQCPVQNCFVTANDTFFEDIRSFEFIVFMGRKVKYQFVPLSRAANQRYIYFNMGSSPHHPLGKYIFDDNFYNWTATYRLDSDIPLPYIQVRDKEGNVVGPKINMKWVHEELVDEEALPADLISQKSKAAAIFYSTCRSLSVREEVVVDLQKALKWYNLSVDVFGECGTYKCAKKIANQCVDKLTEKYFFYLSFETVIDNDYVTDKILTAVQNYVVPIVYGGANYSRFLPPGSYLDASIMTARQLAATIANLMASHQRYLQYFWWKKYYTYHNPILNDNICNICAAINNKTMLERKKYYKKFRSWWENKFHY